MKKKLSILIICAGKGGVGKSFNTVIVSCIMRLLKIPHKLANVEIHGRELLRFYPDALDLTMSEVAINKGKSPLDTILEVKSHLVIDTGANVGRGLIDWMEGVGFMDLCLKKGINVSFGVVVSSFDNDTLDFAEKLYKYAGDRATWYNLQATHTGDNFEMFSGLVAKSKATVISVPSIWADTMELAKREAKPFTDLADDPTLDIAERQRCLIAARRFERAFGPLIEELFR